MVRFLYSYAVSGFSRIVISTVTVRLKADTP